MPGLFVCLFLSLASLQQVTASPRQTYLQDETQQTLQALESLPSHCTQDLASLILAEQSKLPRQVLYCSISSIVIDLAEITVDTAFFGFQAYEEFPALLNDLRDLRKCLNETTLEAKVTCAVEFVPGTVQAAEVIAGALENYVGEMEMIVPLLVQEIQQCRESEGSQYKVFLESALDKATTCAKK